MNSAVIINKLKKRVLKKICSKPNCFWFFIPFLVNNKCVVDINKILKFTKNLNVKKCNFSSKGSFNIMTHNYFYKIPLTTTAFTSFASEKKNYEKYKSILPLCKEYYFCYDKIIYMKMKKINNINIDQKTKESKIYNFLSKQIYNSIKKNINLIDYYSDCLVYLRKICNTYQYSQILEQLQQFSQNEYFVGIEHGDFHEDNILFENNQIVLIDLDNLCDNGLCELDVIHYLVISISRQNLLPWTLQLILFIKNNWFFENEFYNKLFNLISISKNDVGLIYFFNKLKNDIYNNNISIEYSNLIIQFIIKYLEVYNVENIKEHV